MKKQDKVAKVMREFKSGELKSSSGKKVTSPKQAIAIGLSEAGLSKPKMKEGGKVDRMKSKGEHSVQTKSKRGAEMVKMAKGGMAKKMRMGGESTAKRDERAEAAGRRVAKDIEYDEKMRGMKKGGAVKKMASGGLAAGHKQADGCAVKGKTKTSMVKMKKGGKVC
jgi:hypothetical protein